MTRTTQHADPLSRLSNAAAEIATRAAVLYMLQNDLEATDADLTSALRARLKTAIPEALAEAKPAIAANMGRHAEMLFRLSLSLAGIEAAKEAGRPIA